MRIGIIADDLTGANATGVKLKKQGFSALTLTSYEQIPSTGGHNAVCVDTDSRYVSADEAKKRVKVAYENFQQWQADILCKRIDSTARGNIGYEVDALLEAIGEEAIGIIVVSYPDSGRITSGGYLLVNGVPLQTTDVAKDPVNPLKKSFIPNIIQQQSSFKVAHIALETVLEGSDGLQTEMRQKIEQGNRILVVDAVTDDEIEEIAKAMVQLVDYKMIPVDPGPLTAIYSKHMLARQTDKKKILAAIGSVTPTAAAQIQYVLDKSIATPFYVDANRFLEGADRLAEIAKEIADELNELYKTTDTIIVTTNIPNVKQLNLKDLTATYNKKEDKLAKHISDGIANIVLHIMSSKQHRFHGCFSSGGDVTSSICALSGAEGIELQEEVLPLVAYGQLMGGELDGISIITKGGMAGEKDALLKSLKFLMNLN